VNEFIADDDIEESDISDIEVSINWKYVTLNNWSGNVYLHTDGFDGRRFI
jgi:hypothetical protein